MKTSIALGTTQAGLGELVWRHISTTVAEIRHGLLRHRAYKALASLDDRTLADIGVERGRIWEVVDETLGREPASLREGRGSRAKRSIAA